MQGRRILPRCSRVVRLVNKNKPSSRFNCDHASRSILNQGGFRERILKRRGGSDTAYLEFRDSGSRRTGVGWTTFSPRRPRVHSTTGSIREGPNRWPTCLPASKSMPSCVKFFIRVRCGWRRCRRCGIGPKEGSRLMRMKPSSARWLSNLQKSEELIGALWQPWSIPRRTSHQIKNLQNLLPSRALHYHHPPYLKPVLAQVWM
jgi:hypothetical protein